MNPSSLAVRCQNVVKIYDTGDQKVTALNGVNLDIAMGELMMLVGPVRLRQDHVDFSHRRHSRPG